MVGNSLKYGQIVYLKKGSLQYDLASMVDMSDTTMLKKLGTRPYVILSGNKANSALKTVRVCPLKTVRNPDKLKKYSLVYHDDDGILREILYREMTTLLQEYLIGSNKFVPEDKLIEAYQMDRIYILNREEG